MSISGLGYSHYQTQNNVNYFAGLASYIENKVDDSFEGLYDKLQQKSESSAKGADANAALEAYLASVSQGARDDTQDYQEYESENYRIVPDKKSGCFDIYNKQGESLGAFYFKDIVIKQDAATGMEFLISDHGTMWYDALLLNQELKSALRSVMGKDSLETEELQGFTIKRHTKTGIQYLVRAGEEGRGGKVLLQSEADERQYEALAETYYTKYPNLIKSKQEAYIWASLEIRGLAEHTESGILSIHYDGISYSDNDDYKKNWSVMFLDEAYDIIWEYLEKHRLGTKEMQEFAAWQKIFDQIGNRYERIWSKEEMEQGYLYQ